ncbi:MAG: hypothetical protein RJA99_4495 [Pseudomonadota bacterium]|jgi:glycosyltransferase involved in cell wall biosynthesis
MNILFVHQNFPGQFRHLAAELVRRGHAVTALVPRERASAVAASAARQGITVLPYPIARTPAADTHPWIAAMEAKVVRAEACFRAALALRERGLRPDLVIAHPGWGEPMMLKEVWPDARLGLYAEFFYGPRGLDVGFDPEFAVADPGDACRVRLLNLNMLAHLQDADALLSPTAWQAGTYPEPHRSRIAVVHDGIDTDALAPDPTVALSFRTADGRDLTLDRRSEVVTFVNRNLEPYRGYHVFMRALPDLLRRRPDAQVMIVGGDAVGYGARPDPARFGGRSWKQVFLDEIRPRLADGDLARIHFVGRLPYAQLNALMRIASVHVYLTYPFVLSWSLLEAMSLGCAIVGSDTGPVREVIADGETGLLVDFFDGAALVDRVCALLADPAERARLGARARAFARERYDLGRVCLPGQLAWVDALGAGRAAAHG